MRTTIIFLEMRDEFSAAETRFLTEMSTVYLKLARETFLPTEDENAKFDLEEGSPANRLARAISAASMAEFLAGKKAAAQKLIEEAIQLSPENGELTLLQSVFGR